MMDSLQTFGLVAVAAMVVCYALENRKASIHTGVRRVVRTGLDLRLSPGSLAVWSCRGGLVSTGVETLEAGRACSLRNTFFEADLLVAFGRHGFDLEGGYRW